MTDEGKIIEERKRNMWNPRNILAVISMSILLFAFLGTVYGYQNLWFSSAEQKEMVLDYIKGGHSLTTEEVVDVKTHVYDSEDVHQPYKAKLAEWYSRKEGEKLEKEMDKLKKDINNNLEEILKRLPKK